MIPLLKKASHFTQLGLAALLSLRCPAKPSNASFGLCTSRVKNQHRGFNLAPSDTKRRTKAARQGRSRMSYNVVQYPSIQEIRNGCNGFPQIYFLDGVRWRQPFQMNPSLNCSSFDMSNDPQIGAPNQNYPKFKNCRRHAMLQPRSCFIHKTRT